MWEELKSVFDYWIGMGVTIFRVDNPHTKAFPFWEWAIARNQTQEPGSAFSCRSFYAAEDHVSAGEARIQPVVYVFPVAEWEAGDYGLSHGADADAGARILQAEPVAEYARYSD